MIKASLFDLDQRLAETSSLAQLKDAGKWSEVYRLIPILTPYKGVNDLIAELNANDIVNTSKY